MVIIGFDHAVAMLVSIVERFGFGYTPSSGTTTGCRYINFEDNNKRLVPVCIVGQVFADLGILRALARPFEDDSAGEQYGACVYGDELWDTAERFGVTFTDEAKALLYSVQQKQDSPQVWGVALRDTMAEHHNNIVSEAERQVHNAEVARQKALAALPQEPREEFWDEDERKGMPF